MNFVKSSIKKLLVVNTEIKYDTKVKSVKMDYSKWVEIEEKDREADLPNILINEKILTIDSTEKTNERKEIKNDSILAENNKLCKLISVFDEKSPKDLQAQYVVFQGYDLHKVLNFLKNTEYKIDYVILLNFDGKIAKNSIAEIYANSHDNDNLILIYGDEDVLSSDGKREKPWYKPDWAPDDFLSLFYFGGLVALRADKLIDLKVSESENAYDVIYKLLLFDACFDKHNLTSPKICHIPSILFHTLNKEGYEYIKDIRLKNPIKERHTDSMISVIIPSKDHPEILFRCIDSFIEKTLIKGVKFEFILVDNGSNRTNRTLIEELISNYVNNNDDLNIRYIYEEKEFNFSYMCNKGAAEAKGDYLLFLNDDMEIVDSDWLSKIYEKAVLPYAGAVGAKLIYPKSIRSEGDIIQHAGITNLRIGPAHKLQFMSDSNDIYYGRNRYCHDMLGVTGACLMVSKAIFNEVGGFDENLAVAFNDVDLCYSIYEHGYYNIVRNDTVLYHHESLSRGDDAASAEKMLRLTKEKDYLYQKHQDLYGKDPFYNINLTTDMLEQEYAPKYHYEVKLDEKWAEVKEITDVIKASREDKCLRVGMESAMDIYKWKYGVTPECGKVPQTKEDNGFYFQGYTFVIGSNNACFERTLLLRNLDDFKVYGVEVNIEYRPDIRNNLKDQVNVDLTGYTAKIYKDSLPKGNYQFGMYMKDNTSSLRLHNWSNWTITI